jgi:transcriptional regulator with XRE-family HTH domain
VAKELGPAPVTMVGDKLLVGIIALFHCSMLHSWELLPLRVGRDVSRQSFQRVTAIEGTHVRSSWMVKGADLTVRRRLGARLQALRAARDLTQQQIGDLVGRSQKYVSELERGRRSPSWETLLALAHKGFEITLASLMFGIDEDVDAEVHDLSDVVAGLAQEARHDLLRGLALVLRAGAGPK